MKKRLTVLGTVFAAVAIVLVFYAKRRPLHVLLQQPVAPHARTGSQIGRNAAIAVGQSHTNSTARPGYSEKEFTYLQQNFMSHQPQASGPLSEEHLKLHASVVKSQLVVGQRLWPVVKDVIYGNVSALENRLDTGLSPDATVFLGYPYSANVSLLDMAIQAGQRDVIRTLLDHDASVNVGEMSQPGVVPVGGASPKIAAPLPLAAQLGEDDVVRLLLQHGANINQASGLQSESQTALSAAVYSGNVSTAYLLLTSGADINSVLGPGGTVPKVFAQDKSYVTPEMIEMRKLLITFGAKMPSGQ